LQIRSRLKEEGAGKAGCALHPRSHVQCASKQNAHEHTGEAGASRPSLRNGSAGYNVLSLVIGFLATITGGYYRRLGASVEASGPHVFTARSRAVRYRHFRVHRIPPRVS
jgi:hypothetical protein